MTERTTKNYSLIIMRMVVILTCLTLWSICMSSRLVARYTTSGQVEENARVASFLVTEDGNWTKGLSVNIAPGDALEDAIRIISRSEVAVAYTVTVTNVTGNISPLTFSVAGENGTTTDNSRTLTFTGVIQPNDATNHGLIISWPMDDSSPDTNLTYMGQVDYLTITVEATQID